MDRTITVKGSGSASVAPDWVVLPLTVGARHRQHGEAMRLADEALTQIQTALSTVGFKPLDVKTTDFSISPSYESVQEDGNWKQVFTGYECRHGLKLEFALDTALLSSVLDALSGSEVSPEFHLQFTVKDRESVKEQLLAAAAEDAKRKAELLCRASGVRLGALLRIDYNWRDTGLRSESNVMVARAAMADGAAAKLRVEPEDILAKDSAEFVWEIL